jgi:hypothetical protein
MRSGRPPKSPDARRSQCLNVRLTTREFDAAYRLAARRSQSLAAVLRAGLRHLLVDARGRQVARRAYGS